MNLWRHSDFRKFWAGRTISLFGSEITMLALPLTAILTLDATMRHRRSWAFSRGGDPPVTLGQSARWRLG